MGKTSEIDKLPDDCLMQIFQHLPTIADKVRIERVCKRWQNVSQRSWNNFKSLDFSVKTWGIRENLRETPLIRSIDFDKIISLSGRFLTCITTDLVKFGKSCHLLTNIRELQLLDDCFGQENKVDWMMFHTSDYRSKLISDCTDAWQVVLSWLTSHGENLTNFKMDIGHTHYKEEDFARFLGKMKQLKSFDLFGCQFPCEDWGGTFLLKLPFGTIEEIILNCFNMPRFDEGLLSAMIKNSEKLQTLGIDKLSESGIVGVLEVLPSQANTLKNLKMYSSSPFRSQSLLLSTMSALTHLEKLDVHSCSFVNDAFLEVVGKSCKELTYLNIRSCSEVTDRGISSICTLEKMTYLNIQFLIMLRNPPLEKLKSLVVLDASWNLCIEEKYLCSFLEKAHKLRALDLSWCIFQTHKLWHLAIEVAQTRDANNRLDLCVEKSTIDMKVVDETPPFLNIISSNVMKTKYVQYGVEDPFSGINCPEVHML